MNLRNTNIQMKSFHTNFNIDVTPATPAFKVKVVSRDTVAGLAAIRGAITQGVDLAANLAEKPQVYVAFDGADFKAGDFVTLYHTYNGVSTLRFGVVIEGGYTYDDVLKTACHTIIGGFDLPCVAGIAANVALDKARADFYEKLCEEDEHRKIINRIAGNKQLIDEYNEILVAQGREPITDADVIVATGADDAEEDGE